MKFLAAFTDTAYALMRIATGAMFAVHGLQKVFGLLGGSTKPFGSQLWIGGLIELVCGLALVAGWYTRFAAFLASGTMAVAYVQFHWKGAMGADLIPTVNKGELALVYAFVFLFIACRGGVKWSANKD